MSRVPGSSPGSRRKFAMTAEGDSRRIAILVNVAKIALLAALAPPVVAGIAQRAAFLGAAAGGTGIDTAAIVAATVSTGSVCAVLGAIGFGFLADIGRTTTPARWGWVFIATGVGTVGLVLLALSPSFSSLLVGWATAQFGCSGAMAVLRAILAAALPSHRRRGAVIAVLGGYGGLLIPLGLLLVFPGSIWQTTFGLAAASLVVPAVALAGVRRVPRRAVMLSDRNRVDPDGGSPAGRKRSAPSTQTLPREAADSGRPQPYERGRPLSPAALIVIQCAANVVLAAFLSYHPLDLASRAAEDAHFPVRASVWVLVAAVLGLLAAVGVLLARPVLLARSRIVVVVAGALLAASLVLRAVSEPLVMVGIAAALSGAAVGLNNSALLAGALEAPRPDRRGRSLGLFSAAGALGQFVGPMAALGVLSLAMRGASTVDAEGFRVLFLLLALVPAAWAIGAAAGGARSGRR